MKFHWKKSVCTALVSGVISASGASTASAETYLANMFLPPQSPFSIAGYTEWSENVAERTNGEITFETHYGESLLSGRATLKGIADGVVQVGWAVTTYNPAELPVANLLAEMALLSDNPYALMAANTEMGFFNPMMVEEYARNGVVFGGGYNSTPFYLMCRKPINTLEELQGSRLRMGGGAWDRWARAIGAEPINVSSNESYLALDRGNIECSVNPIEAFLTRSWGEVAPYVPKLKLGTYYGGTLWAFDREFWQSLTNEQRRILLEEDAKAGVRSVTVYMEKDDAARETEGKEGGVKFLEIGPELKKAHEKYRQEELSSESLAALANEKYGLEEEVARDLVKRFKELVTEWEERLKDVDRRDEDAVTELLIEEIYSRVDVTTFGM